LGISFEKPNCIYRKVQLTPSQMKPYQYSLHSNGFTGESLQSTLYCCCSDVDVDFPIKSSDCSHSSLVQLFGIEQYHLLDYLNVNKIRVFSQTKAGIHSTRELQQYAQVLKSYPRLQSKCIIMSSMMLYAIGTTTAMDVDTLVSNRHEDCDPLIQSLEKKGIDVKVLRKDEHWEEHGKVLGWMKKSFSTDWVKASGYHEISDFFMDSRCFFYLHGLKYISLPIQIQRIYKRNSANSFVDLIAIHYNNCPVKFPCIHPLQFRQGKLDILDHAAYQKMIRSIQENLKEWQSFSLSISDLKEMYPMCLVKPHSNLDHLYAYFIKVMDIYKQMYPSSYTCFMEVDSIPNLPVVILHTINPYVLTHSLTIKSFSVVKGNPIRVTLGNTYEVPINVHLNGYKLYERHKILEYYDDTLDLDELHIARLFATYVFKRFP